MTKQELLEKLVATWHLSVSEREILGTSTVPRNEIAAIVKAMLVSNRRFPMDAAPWEPGKAVFEGASLYLQPNRNVRVLLQHANPASPFALAHSRELQFSKIDDAIKFFIDTEWKNGIDGIKLI